MEQGPFPGLMAFLKTVGNLSFPSPRPRSGGCPLALSKAGEAGGAATAGWAPHGRQGALRHRLGVRPGRGIFVLFRRQRLLLTLRSPNVCNLPVSLLHAKNLGGRGAGACLTLLCDFKKIR
jgi:hypothetical protein